MVFVNTASLFNEQPCGSKLHGPISQKSCMLLIVKADFACIVFGENTEKLIIYLVF